MHENMARPLSRDADGKPLMTLEELKEGMFQSIRDNGTVELIRAQLRRRFIEKLQQQRQFQANDAERPPCHVSTPDEKLVNGLVLEYLTNKGLENTRAVFLPEIGGSQNQLDRETVLQLLRVSSDLIVRKKNEQEWTDQSLLFVLVQERRRRVTLATMDSQTQTAMDCFDHRLVLEKELRRVETCYLATCAAQKDVPQKSLEERMIDYEREYNDICDQRLQDEIERFQSTEIALVRTEERKRYSRELDNLRTTLVQESRAKQAHLQERERDCELAFVARKTELETSLFETRQSLFQDKEKLRVKEAELQVKTEQEFRRVALETQRLQTWEESVRTQEENVQSLIAQRLREKERVYSRERQEMVRDLEQKEEALMQCKQALATLKDQVNALEHEVGTLNSSLMKCNKELQVAQATTLQLNTAQQELVNQVTKAKAQVEDYKLKYVNADMTITRLVAEANATKDLIRQCKAKSGKRKAQLLSARNEIQSFQQQVYDLKLCEGTTLMGERKKLMQVINAERQEFQWQENEWRTKVREMTTRVAEAEALASKFQNQFEDEKVHVETLRQDVASLNALLTQAQATIMAKHGHGTDWPRSRGRRSLLDALQPKNDLMDKMDQIMATLHRRDDVAQKWHATGTQVAYNWQGQQKSEWQTTTRDTVQVRKEWQEDRPQLNEKGRAMAKQEREGHEKRCEWIASESVEERQQAMALDEGELREKSFQGEEKKVVTLVRAEDKVHERKAWCERREEETGHVERARNDREENEVRMKWSEEREGEGEGWRQAKNEREEEEDMGLKEVQTALQQEDDGRREEARRWVEEERREAERVDREDAVENLRLAICVQDDRGDVKESDVEASIVIETVENQALDTVNDGISGTENVVDEKCRETNDVESTSLSILSCVEEENPSIVEERTMKEDEKLAVDVDAEESKNEDKELTINDNKEENKKEGEKVANDLNEEETKSEDEDEKVAVNANEEETKKENERVAINLNEEETNNEDEKVAIDVNEDETKNEDKELTINDNDEESKKEDEKVAVKANEEETKNEDEKVAVHEHEEEIKHEDEKAVVDNHEDDIKKEDETFMDVYRQRVIARKAAEKQHELERGAPTAREEPGDQAFYESSESDHDLELSGGSFAESSAASTSDSF